MSEWKMKNIPIQTPWADRVDPEDPLGEYPRPQMKRDAWRSLNGLWEYAVTPIDSSLPAAFDGMILVPYCLESVLSGVGRSLSNEEQLWYRRSFTLPEEWKDKNIHLNFGAVDWRCEVYVNGRNATSHTGGYMPFCADITEDVSFDGENELIVKVWDPTDTHWQQRGKQVMSPGGIYYTAVSGIWQTVWLEAVDDVYVKGIRLTPDIDSSRISVAVDVSDCEAVVNVAIKDADGEVIEEGSGGAEMEFFLSEARLWSPEDPYLYGVEISVESDGRITDVIESYFGMRKYSLENDEKGHVRICLNNEPYFQYGLLDQGYWPEGIYTPPSDQAYVFDIARAKELGFNMLRKHTKVEPLRWYYWCDRLGMIVWQDMIAGGKCSSSNITLLTNMLLRNNSPGADTTQRSYSSTMRDDPRSRDDYERELDEMISLLYNVTCICTWVPFNESWGQFDAARIAGKIRHQDPTRLIDHASGWIDQGAGDMLSEHIYFRSFRKPFFDGRRAYAVSECGGFALQYEGHLWTDRYFGYAKLKSVEALTDRYERFVLRDVIPVKKQGCSAVIYTQISDVEQEVNGIFTYDRKEIKFDADRLIDINKRIFARDDERQE